MIINVGFFTISAPSEDNICSDLVKLDFIPGHGSGLDLPGLIDLLKDLNARRTFQSLPGSNLKENPELIDLLAWLKHLAG
jgi:hypothetical protein